MSTLSDTQLRAIEQGLSTPVERLSGARRAVIACIVRRPQLRAAAVGIPLQVLFILRAAREGSRWSGQVGFPGGHAEGSETDEQAVVRETREEVGLHLDAPGAYRHLGEVKQRKVHGADLVVCCHVYEQLQQQRRRHGDNDHDNDNDNGSSPGVIRPADLQASEVAACGWAPITALTGSACLRPLEWPPPPIVAAPGDQTAATGSGDGGQPPGSGWDGFPSVLLPFEEGGVVVAAEAASAAGRAPPSLSERQVRAAFSLWGLTLGVVNDWLVTCGLREAPIDEDAVQKAVRERAGADSSQL